MSKISMHSEKVVDSIIQMKRQGISSRDVAAKVLGRRSAKSTVNDIYNRYLEMKKTSSKANQKKPKILLIDIETTPVLAHIWNLFSSYIPIDRIVEDWRILSFSAKWYGEPEESTIFRDNREDIDDDFKLLAEIHDMLCSADFVIGHNAENFDVKKINARLVENGLTPPTRYKVIDTLVMAKKGFNFTSNKLAFLTQKLCKKYVKDSHEKFAGHRLWEQCIKGNPEAWEEMEKYNRLDVLSLEELYDILKPWYVNHPSVAIYGDLTEMSCDCGSTDFKESGFHYTKVSKFQKYQCQCCGTEYRSRVNLLSKEERSNILLRV